METLKITIENKFDRSILGEGRNYGIGFAFLNPTKDSKVFDTMQAFTACKDYLNDLVFIEKFKVKLSKVFGFEHTYTGFFKDKEFVYLGVQVVHYKTKKPWEKFEEASKTLIKNKKNLLTSLNKLEEFLGLTTNRTSIEGEFDDGLLLKIPSFWVERGWLISLYTLWIRCFFNIEEKISKFEFTKMINSQETNIFIKQDAYLFKVIQTFITQTGFDELIKQDNPVPTSTAGVVHGLGISGIVKFLTKLKKDDKQKEVVKVS